MKLPIDAIIPQITQALKSGPAVVIQAPTGSGKTTRTPPALLDSGILGDGQLIMLQPRRVAARACAHAMASMRGEITGDAIGYQIRFEKRASHKTRILVVTEGILTRRFQSDPLLEGVSCVVLDEFHERSIHTDLALAFLKELAEIRDDLKIVVMSATLKAEPVSQFLFNCPVLTAESRAWPLAILYQPIPPRHPHGLACEAAIKTLLSDPNDDGGHILIFLPGAPEIRRTLQHLQATDWGADLMPLHGSLTSREQDAVLAPGGRRRIILATNIAETSLTIEGVSAVIDSGWKKALIHDPGKGIDRLDTVRISRASATQRAGRAGRTGPGRALRLWDQGYHAIMAEEDPPEMAQADLASMTLQILDFHGPDLSSFPFFQKPPQAALEGALNLLQLLGAIHQNHRLTEKGKSLNGLPLHPRIASIMYCAAKMDMISDGAGICALLSERSPNLKGHLMDQLEAISKARPGHDRTMGRILDVKTQLKKQATRIWPKATFHSKSPNSSQLARMILAGYPDRLCVVRSPGMGVMVGGRGVTFETHNESFSLFLALDLVEVGTHRVAGKARQIVPLTLEDVTSVLETKTIEAAVFDEKRETVMGVRRIDYAGLTIQEKSGVKLDAHSAANILTEQAAAQFPKIFQPNPKASALLFRLRFAADKMPEESWPDFSEEGLKARLPELCQGKKSFNDLKKLDWQSIFLNNLSWPLRRLLDKEVPERLEVPSGSMVAIDYESTFEAAGYPILAVRLQEMFGQSDTPRIAKGRVPLLLHLLAPNFRPCQITRDLKGFWDKTYIEVRKELRQRYPKHSWPEDPWTAQPMRGAKRRKS